MTALTMPAAVPFVDLAALHAQVAPELAAALERTVLRGTYILGEEGQRLEREFADYCGAAHAVGVDSGTSALELTLRALGIGAGDEVITAANSFVASAFAISYTGATPVFVDVAGGTRNIDVTQIESAITARTRAIVPVHLYGQPADMDAVLSVARRHGLMVVEDACQAHGARYRGRRVGSLADAAAFSFYPAKNLGAIGDAGMVVTGDARLAERVRLLRNYGQKEKNLSSQVGYNHRLDEIQAAVLRVKLPRLDGWNQARTAIAEAYLDGLADTPQVVLPVDPEDVTSVWHLFVVEVPRRDIVRRQLEAAGVQTGIHYPIPIPHQPAYRHLGWNRGAFPVSERSADRLLSLPMHPFLEDRDVERVMQVLRRACAGEAA